MTASDHRISLKAKLNLGSFALDADFESDVPLLAIFGPSGAGKTTLLNVLAGLSRPDGARIEVAGTLLNDTDAGLFVPPHRRRVAVVFQDQQLFPHLTVEQNIKFARWFSRTDGNKLSFEEVIDRLGIEHILKRRPAKLSGGERQRVALARALVASPRLLLMDEPLASLDEERRNEILALIERVRDTFGIPIFYVTHRSDEVQRLAQKLVHIEHGRTSAVQNITRAN